MKIKSIKDNKIVITCDTAMDAFRLGILTSKLSKSSYKWYPNTNVIELCIDIEDIINLVAPISK